MNRLENFTPTGSLQDNASPHIARMKLEPKYQKLVAVLIFTGSIVLSLSVLFIPIDQDKLQALGYGGMFIITFLGALSLFVPGPTMLAAFLIGSALNPLLVSLVAGLGSAIGETTGYTAGYATRTFINTSDESNHWYTRIINWMVKFPFLTIFILAAIPNFITDLSGLIAGRIRYSYFKFLLATFLGKTIRFGIGAYLGAVFGIEILRKFR